MYCLDVYYTYWSEKGIISMDILARTQEILYVIIFERDKLKKNVKMFTLSWKYKMIKVPS